jgi:ParB family chromosome partitioning protein
MHDEAALSRLAHWIRRRGLLHPILVRALGADGFEVVAGERRLLAAERAGLMDIECRVRAYTDPHAPDEPPGDVLALEDALVENLVRENLTKLEESEAILELVCLHVGETHSFVLERLGAMHGRAVRRKSPVNLTVEDDAILEVFAALNLIGWRAFYTHRTPLLRLPDPVKRLLLERRVGYATATRIARLEPAACNALVQEVRAGHLHGTALQRKLDRLLEVTTTPNRIARLRRALATQLEHPEVQTRLAALEHALGLR